MTVQQGLLLVADGLDVEAEALEELARRWSRLPTGEGASYASVAKACRLLARVLRSVGARE